MGRKREWATPGVGDHDFAADHEEPGMKLHRLGQALFATLFLCALLGAPRAAAPPAVKEAFSKGQWTEDIEGAMQLSKETHRPIVALFTGSDWCAWCKMLDQQILSRPDFRDRMKGKCILLVVDFPRKSSVPGDVKLGRQHLAEKYGVRGYPTVVVLKEGDQSIGSVVGFRSGTTYDGYMSQLENLTLQVK
jgi:thioredoxin-related protein